MYAGYSPANVRGLGFTSLALGILGAVFYWWTPAGMVLSLAGLITGFIGWMLARKTATGFGLVIAGMAVCIAALVLDFVVAGMGLEWIRIQAVD